MKEGEVMSDWIIEFWGRPMGGGEFKRRTVTVNAESQNKAEMALRYDYASVSIVFVHRVRDHIS